MNLNILIIIFNIIIAYNNINGINNIYRWKFNE